MVLIDDTFLQLADLRVLRGDQLIEQLNLNRQPSGTSQTHGVRSGSTIVRRAGAKGVELLVEPGDHSLNPPLSLGATQSTQVRVECRRQLARRLVVRVIARR